MSEEVMTADANLAHIARLQERLNHALTERREAVAALEAARSLEPAFGDAIAAHDVNYGPLFEAL